MSTHLIPNLSFKCIARSLTGLSALLLPASDELVTMQGAPVGKLFTVAFNDLYSTLKDGDLLTNEADPTDTYRLRGIKHITSPRLSHTHGLAERGVS